MDFKTASILGAAVLVAAALHAGIYELHTTADRALVYRVNRVTGVVQVCRAFDQDVFAPRGLATAPAPELGRGKGPTITRRELLESTEVAPPAPFWGMTCDGEKR
jgi:hypothetical protein